MDAAPGRTSIGELLIVALNLQRTAHRIRGDFSGIRDVGDDQIEQAMRTIEARKSSGESKPEEANAKLATENLKPARGAIRFDQADIDTYRTACRSAGTPATNGGATNSTATFKAAATDQWRLGRDVQQVELPETQVHVVGEALADYHRNF